MIAASIKLKETEKTRLIWTYVQMNAATVYHFEGSGFTLRSFKSVCPDSIANFSSLPGILHLGPLCKP